MAGSHTTDSYDRLLRQAATKGGHGRQPCGRQLRQELRQAATASSYVRSYGRQPRQQLRQAATAAATAATRAGRYGKDLYCMQAALAVRQGS